MAAGSPPASDWREWEPGLGRVLSCQKQFTKSSPHSGVGKLVSSFWKVCYRFREHILKTPHFFNSKQVLVFCAPNKIPNLLNSFTKARDLGFEMLWGVCLHEAKCCIVIDEKSEIQRGNIILKVQTTVVSFQLFSLNFHRRDNFWNSSFRGEEGKVLTGSYEYKLKVTELW